MDFFLFHIIIKEKGPAYLDVTHHNSVLISAGGRVKRLS